MCRLWAEQDEGPYHRDAQPTRRDVVEDRQGVALQLGIRLARDGDATTTRTRRWRSGSATRSAATRASRHPTLPSSSLQRPRRAASTCRDQTFLRGRQTTDAAGMVEFHTIYPGWYPGRTVHIHLMVHAGDAVLTSQLYFPDEVSDRVLAKPPYAAAPRSRHHQRHRRDLPDRR